MMELYKKYRPKRFKGLVGNEATVEAIRSKIESKSLPHFILLSGPSGCGKTTIARIIKEGLECESQDFYEINCANRNGVELAREIESKFRMKSIHGTAKIWLLDEAHKMTSACAESLLKPLEDTPDHVYFIFATTDPQKILKTIKTRATSFTVEALSASQVTSLINKVCKKEKIKITDEILENIIEGCQGSARLALVILDKIKDLDKKSMLKASKEMVESQSKIFDVYKCLMWDRNWDKCRKALSEVNEDEESVRRFILACASNCLLKPNKGKNHQDAHKVLESFEQPFYNSGRPGLTLACYEVIKGLR